MLDGQPRSIISQSPHGMEREATQAPLRSHSSRNLKETLLTLEGGIALDFAQFSRSSVPGGAATARLCVPCSRFGRWAFFAFAFPRHPVNCFLKCSTTAQCSAWGLKIMISASTPTRTEWPGGQ
jgi:hypothetical protein